MKYFQGKININGQLIEGKSKNDLNEIKNSDSKVYKNADTMNKLEGELYEGYPQLYEKNSSFGNNEIKNWDEPKTALNIK